MDGNRIPSSRQFMCLRRYTMELRLGGIEEAWRARNLRFTASRDLIWR
jgi:hypothetical protein